MKMIDFLDNVTRASDFYAWVRKSTEGRPTAVLARKGHVESGITGEGLLDEDTWEQSPCCFFDEASWGCKLHGTDAKPAACSEWGCWKGGPKKVPAWTDEETGRLLHGDV